MLSGGSLVDDNKPYRTAMGENWDGSNSLLFLFGFTALNPLEPFCFGGFVVHEEHASTKNMF